MSNSIYFETERMIVRAWQPEDITGLYKVMSDVRVHTYTKDKNNPWDRERTEKYIRFMIEKDFKTLDNYHGAVIEKTTNQVIGLCGLNPYKEKEPEIEWKLGVPFWGKGYATEAVGEIVHFAFKILQLHRIESYVMPRNSKSIRVMEKLNFMPEGISKRCLEVNGKWEDHIRFSLLNE